MLDAAFAASRCASAAADAQLPRAVSVADSITLRQFVSDPLGRRTICTSPDLRRSAFTIRSGNLKTGKVDYSVLMLDAPLSPGQLSARPKEVLRVSSSSNAPGVENLRWSSNGANLFFSGDAGDGYRRVFRLRIVDRELTALTPDHVDVLSFDITGDGRALAFTQVGEKIPPMTAAQRQAGILIDKINYWEMTSDQELRRLSPRPGRLVILRDGRKTSFPLQFNIGNRVPGVSISPSGELVLMIQEASLAAETAPSHWASYSIFGVNVFQNYWLIDTTSGNNRRLFDAPSDTSRSVVWTGVRTVLLPATNVPLENTGSDKKPGNYAVEVDVSNGQHAKVAAGKFDVESWDAKRQIVTLANIGGSPAAARSSYRKTVARWEELDSVDAQDRAGEVATGEVVVEEALNLPPRLIWRDAGGRRVELFDPNPQLESVNLGDAREIDVPLHDGKALKATLFLPAGWNSGTKYPAVLQTHGRNPNAFTLDGNEMTSGFSARALAARGVLVVQLAETWEPYPDAIASTREAPVGATVFEDVVDELVRSYGVDRSRVGIFGFSRTGISTRYALAHSRQRYAAAVESDSYFVGYSLYVNSENTQSQSTMRNVIGAEPFAAGLQDWIQKAPAFSAHKIETPLLIMNFTGWGALLALEEVVPLRHLNKPVELVHFPDAKHNPVKPFERFAVQSRYVDWFRFWLQGYEDPDPAKAAQYIRWHKLRDQRDANRAGERQPGAISVR